MTLAFWDSSGFLKLLIEEPGRDLAVDVWNDAGDSVASRLAVPEVSAAIASARRGGRLNDLSEREARRRWARYRNAIELIDVTATIGDRAAHLAEDHHLSGADAVHLASALSLISASPIVMTWDRRLGTAAAAVGLTIVPETT